MLMQHSSGFLANLGVDYDLYLLYGKNKQEDGYLLRILSKEFLEISR